jgi:alpha-galactosidase/6-phospho-beta-glucosidase family protein
MSTRSRRCWAIPFFLTVRNRGYTPEFDADDILEVPHRFSGGTLEPLGRIGFIPETLREPLNSFVTFEREAANAVRNRDAVGLADALKCHPWVGDDSVATKVALEIGR